MFMPALWQKGLFVVSDEIHEFLAGFRLVEGATEIAGGGDAVLFFHATHLHAQMACLNHDHHAKGMECAVDAVFDLLCHALLHLQPMTEDVDDA